MKNMKNLLSRESMLSTFGCSVFETEILEVINKDLAAGQMPNFQIYNLEETNCECRTGNCCWNEAEIMKRLRETGVWAKVEALHAANTKKALPAHLLENGKFSVAGYAGEFPNAGKFDNYREMDAVAASLLSKYPSGYVCHVAHNEPEDYVLMLPKGSEYIVLYK